MMGILSNLFGTNRSGTFMPHAMTSVLPDSARNQIQGGRLPQLNIQTLLLDAGEVCHYVDKACLITEITQTYYRGTHGGFSTRVMKGLSYRTGRSKSIPIKEKVPEYTRGYLYITNRRIIFAARKNGLDKKIAAITAIAPYSNAIGLQFGSKTYKLLTPTPDTALAVLHLVR